MGVGVMDALAPEPLAGAALPQQVVGIVDLVAALAQHGAAVLLADDPGGGLHAGGVGDGHVGEDLGLRDVGGQHFGQGQQLGGQGRHGVIPQQLGAGGGYHHGVDHDVLSLVKAQPLRNRSDQLCRGYHADLDGIGVDVGKDGVQLLREELGGRLKNVGHAGGVLGGQGGDSAHGKNAVGGHRLDVSLDTGASAGITASNGQCCFHRRYFLSYMHSKVL